ncbi:hypothetical protein [Actinophytocola glycyrrhizae]|uniref:Uncharacterized protein n=1 Tax=Actinophytocola glycyrrhizae TaxID=2044873 RepID=A0ABV9RWJ6_9PSEU
MERATAGQQTKPIHDLGAKSVTALPAGWLESCRSEGRRRSGCTGDRAGASGAEDFSL